MGKHSQMIVREGEQLKSCTACGAYKPTHAYTKKKKGKYGLNPKCKDCEGIGPKRKARLIEREGIMLKSCTACDELKPLDAYNLNNTGVGGRVGQCRACQVAMRMTEEFRAKARERAKRWRQKNPEKARERDQRLRERSIDKRQIYSREYSRKLRAEQHERILAEKRDYYQRNRDKEQIRIVRWLRDNPDKAKGYYRNRAEHIAKGFVEDVSISVVYSRDKGICSICHRYVKDKDKSMDHIIPVSQGGEHSYANIALAHRRCNSTKGNRTTLQQMRLF